MPPFEPTHGFTPKHTGQYKVNSIAMFLTDKLILDSFEEKISSKTRKCYCSGY